MTERSEGSYWGRLWAAILGRRPDAAEAKPISEPEPTPAPVETPPPSADAALQAEVARLKLDLEDRDHRIATMQRDYQLLQETKSQETAAAGDEQLQKVFKKLSGVLANLVAMAQIADSGQAVDAASFVKLVHSLNRELGRAGLECIGKVGETVGFNVAEHQRMSGGAVHPDAPVIVRLPGFRFGQKILNKAMVSAPDNGAKGEE
jgi:molecular chaperone GrpE (heat shock protein)